jgi:hypothetical protein
MRLLLPSSTGTLLLAQTLLMMISSFLCLPRQSRRPPHRINMRAAKAFLGHADSVATKQQSGRMGTRTGVVALIELLGSGRCQFRRLVVMVGLLVSIPAATNTAADPLLLLLRSEQQVVLTGNVTRLRLFDRLLEQFVDFAVGNVGRYFVDNIVAGSGTCRAHFLSVRFFL